MNKSVKRSICLALGVLTAFSVVACKKKSKDPTEEKQQVYDTETRPLVMATEALDGNFNPFFATSATDTEVIAMTQIGMLGVDKDGKPTCGENEATVALDYKETMLKGDRKTATKNANEASFTEYEFIIKNDIKFSDGVALTIKDVLFNLYVYLDPVYMGSATIYSTDIVGLKSYRAQNNNMEEASESEIQQLFYAGAQQRYTNILNYLEDPAESGLKPDEVAQVQTDLYTIFGEEGDTEALTESQKNSVFYEEVESDWTNSVGQKEAYEEKYTFTTDWEIYLYNAGVITNETEGGESKRDEDGKYVMKDYSHYVTSMREETEQENLDAYIAANPGVSDEVARETLIKNKAIEIVFNNNIALDHSATGASKTFVLKYWMTGANALEKFVAEEKTKWFANVDEKVESISGITTTTTTTDYDGNDLGAEHDVLKIMIYGVDPKAIWNFAFGVAPMHYYSNQETINSTKYGVKMGDIKFFDTVLKDSEKTKLPMGAGVYKASNAKETNVDGSSFYNNNWVYFERNTYFETVGEGLCNAKIKKLRFKVVSPDNVIQALESKDIDYGEPNASVDNMTKLSGIDHITSFSYKTNGYGYVGVNPKHVPDLEVRQAIMMAMDTLSIIKVYYGGTLADPIYRPMSTTNWAYPTGVKEYKDVAYTTNKDAIIQRVKDSGKWTMGTDGKFYNDKGQTLKYKFTIAGESTDHPAFKMFEAAAETLNDCGFDITVGTDVSALSKLASGELAVWAAAWSSTVDPDMYQVYHKDSNATSVKNWGYDVILHDTTGKYSREYDIIVNQLSPKIEEGRETIDEAKRKKIYAEALDMVMKLAVELPTYQRNDCVAFNKDIIDAATLNQNPTANAGVTDRLWEVNYN
ncbi:MAG: hypothetical protein IJX49_02060 [Clostridia bacterium]|nr:hypothetical protein [Clostridia bacterium]